MADRQRPHSTNPFVQMPVPTVDGQPVERSPPSGLLDERAGQGNDSVCTNPFAVSKAVPSIAAVDGRENAGSRIYPKVPMPDLAVDRDERAAASGFSSSPPHTSSSSYGLFAPPQPVSKDSPPFATTSTRLTGQHERAEVTRSPAPIPSPPQIVTVATDKDAESLEYLVSMFPNTDPTIIKSVLMSKDRSMDDTVVKLLELSDPEFHVDPSQDNPAAEALQKQVFNDDMRREQECQDLEIARRMAQIELDEQMARKLTNSYATESYPERGQDLPQAFDGHRSSLEVQPHTPNRDQDGRSGHPETGELASQGSTSSDRQKHGDQKPHLRKRIGSFLRTLTAKPRPSERSHSKPVP